jgi:dipeptidyl aminopeptidase/acylaminoacyl peptidase
MTPELMWKFGRLGSIALSPDGSTILYTVTEIDLQTEVRRTNIFRVPVSGGDPVQLTTEGGSSPQWFDNGKSIAYVDKDGNLAVMDPEGKVKQTVAGLKEFEIFNIAPAGNHIYFTRRVKLDQTANEKYNLPKAHVRIISDLMYRHWNYWSDYSYSHIFAASFDGKSVSDEKDIMSGQRFESPMSPYFDEGEISWSPDGKYIAYTSKRLFGKEDARSTNSDIYLYDITSGKEINISEGNRGYDRYPVFSPDGSKIAYQSMERDGYEADLDRLFVFDIKTRVRTWVTKGWIYDAESINWADNQTLYFTCAYLGTVQVFKTNLEGKGVDKVTDGVHDLGSLSVKSGVMIATLTSMSMAPEVSKVDMATGEIK